MAQKGFTWSDVAYPGTEVYNKLVMFDFSGVSGSSVYVVYSTLSVQDGVLSELSKLGSIAYKECDKFTSTCICRLGQSHTCTCTVRGKHR